MISRHHLKVRGGHPVHGRRRRGSLICEGEIDALTAIQAGEIGVGLPGWSHWKDAWIGDFKGKDVVLVMDADDAGRKGTRDIAGRFIRAGIPAPRQLILDEGEGLE